MTLPNATSPQTLEAYTLLQVAAETFLNGSDREDSAALPTGSSDFAIDPGWLIKGNLHSSRMTSAQAAKFATDWKVLSHQANTATGFSATLFE